MPECKLKLCPKCKTEPPAGEKGYCKECHAEYMRQWRKKEKEKLQRLKDKIKEIGEIHT